MPASRVLLGLLAPLVGAGAAWLIAAAAGSSYPFSEFQAVVLGSWLVMALGAWVKLASSDGLRARVAVIGSREFAADFVAELEAANVRTYEVVGWISSQGPAEYRRLRWLGTPRRGRARRCSRERIELIVCGPNHGDAEGSRIEDVSARVAEECLDLPVRLIAANQLYEETFGHVPVGMIDAAWYRYIMHPRFRAAGPHSKRVFDLVLGAVIALLFLPGAGGRGDRDQAHRPRARSSTASAAWASSARSSRSSSCARCGSTPRRTARSGRRSATTA